MSLQSNKIENKYLKKQIRKNQQHKDCKMQKNKKINGCKRWKIKN